MTTTNYILIDSNSGYIWGQAYADTPIDACRLVDEGCGASGREYVEYGPNHSILRDGLDGYLVYAAPENFRVDDGQDQSEIDAVSAMPLTAIVTCSPLEL
jgi:hypothetical protein